MNGWMEVPNLVMSAAALLIMLTGFFVVMIVPGIDRWSKRFFIVFFMILVLCGCAYFVDTIVYKYPDMATAERIVVYLESLLASFLMPMLTIYLLHTCGENWRKSILLRAVLILLAVYFILLNITQFTTFIYYITPDNRYYRGPLYPLLLIPPIMIMIINLVGVIRRRSKLTKEYYHGFLIYLIVPSAAMLVQMFFFGLLFMVIGMALSSLWMFALVLSEQIRQNIRQQQEIARQQASIMVLQMRPHFIYNTMMSIYYLCDQDPKKAQQVTLDFTTYLRKNFTAIASDKTIPFSEELEHTRAYLAVGQAQFEDGIFVEYDTPHTRFRVPPLTLQPIVENAVKYGMDPDSDPLSIRIQTKSTANGSMIIIEDNGPGFEDTDNNEPHIALNNIQQRLKMMCGGSLTISRREGGGTVVIVRIPYDKEN